MTKWQFTDLIDSEVIQDTDEYRKKNSSQNHPEYRFFIVHAIYISTYMNQPPLKNIVLAIETSCDETAISIVEDMHVLSHHIHSQATLHAEFGGVFPNLAKREHAKNIIPLLSLVFHDICDTPIYIPTKIDVESLNTHLNLDLQKNISKILDREEQTYHDLCSYISQLTQSEFLKIKKACSVIAVTYGPGLEPALWVGISTAKALATIFDLPLYPINHMEGHIASVLAQEISHSSLEKNEKPTWQFPAIALLISGGHTELVEVTDWCQYRILGKTVDDAVGEAYDKVARLIGLPYPGGPAVSHLANTYRKKHHQNSTPDQVDIDNHDFSASNKYFQLPRPMLHSKDFNFSFSGLKTAVLYAVKNTLTKLGNETNGDLLPEDYKEALAGEFEEAVVDVLLSKTKKAIEHSGAKTLIIGGGVIANAYIRSRMNNLCSKLGINLLVPQMNFTTDNASMIGLVAVLHLYAQKKGFYPGDQDFETLKADGNAHV